MFGVDRHTVLAVLIIIVVVALSELLRYDNARSGEEDVGIEASSQGEESIEDILDEAKEKQEEAIKVHVQKAGPWAVGNCAMVTGDVTWLVEWLELQLQSGMGHVWVAPRSMTIAQRKDLTHYTQLGFVTVLPDVPYSHPGCQYTKTGEISDPSVFSCIVPKHCLESVNQQAKWLLISDASEFIFPHKGCSLTEYMLTTCDFWSSHFRVGWERFGNGEATTLSAALLTETFLSSGGDCSIPTKWQSNRWSCHLFPDRPCRGCRQFKVMYNTQCLTVAHAGAWDRLVNTTDWKADQSNNKIQWLQSEGNETDPMANPSCTHLSLRGTESKCWHWHMRAKENPDYNSLCCGAGLGMNKYLPFELTPREMYISTSALRFLRGMRQRLAQIGRRTSDAVAFIDVQGKSCFSEAGIRYLLHEENTNSTSRSTFAMDIETCCDLCHVDPRCDVFTYLVTSHSCTLISREVLIHTTVNSSSIRAPMPHHIHARRTLDPAYKSGVPFRNGECRL